MKAYILISNEISVCRMFECASYDAHTRHTATSPKLMKRSKSLIVSLYNFSKQQYVFPEDECGIEIYMSVLSVLM